MVAERTEQLEQKVRELLALNVLFQEHLRQRFEVVEGYRELLGGIRGVAKQAHNLIERAQSQPLPDLREVSDLTLEKVATINARGIEQIKGHQRQYLERA